MPYVSAAILLQLVIFFVPRLRAAARRGEAGRAARSTAKRSSLTVLLAAFQSYGIAGGLEGVTQSGDRSGTAGSALTTVLTLTAGTLFVIWLRGRSPRAASATASR